MQTRDDMFAIPASDHVVVIGPAETTRRFFPRQARAPGWA
jgi:hypothetical protein